MHYFACVRWFLAQEESYFANPIKINKNEFHPQGSKLTGVLLPGGM